MAVSFNHGGRGRRGRRPMSEINVTPLVDVMLVLLIIFMITAPLLVTGVPVDLPDTRAGALAEDKTPIQISIDQTGQLFIDEMPVAEEGLPEKLRAIAEARGDDAPVVYVRADSGLDYGRVMSVVGEINSAGFRKLSLVSEPRKGA